MSPKSGLPKRGSDVEVEENIRMVLRGNSRARLLVKAMNRVNKKLERVMVEEGCEHQ